MRDINSPLITANNDLLMRDMSIYEELEGYDNPYKAMILESITARWGSRVVKREAFNYENMWEVFFDWIVSISRTILDTVNDLVGQGRRALRTHTKLLDTYTTFREKAKTPTSGMVTIEPYAKYFIVNDKYNYRYCKHLGASLAKDSDELVKWSINGIKEATNVLKMTRSTSGKFDTIENINVNGKDVGLTRNLGVFIGEKISKPLNSYSSRGDSDETQYLWALPGNAYLHYFSLFFHEKVYGVSRPIEGTRYLEPTFQNVNDREYNGNERLMTLKEIKEEIDQIKPLALGLIEMETNNSKIQREIDELRRHVTFAKKAERPVSLDDKYTYRLARERLTSANTSVRTILHTYRVLLKGKLKRIEMHQKAYLV